MCEHRWGRPVCTVLLLQQKKEQIAPFPLSGEADICDPLHCLFIIVSLLRSLSSLQNLRRLLAHFERFIIFRLYHRSDLFAPLFFYPLINKIR